MFFARNYAPVDRRLLDSSDETLDVVAMIVVVGIDIDHSLQGQTVTRG
jgi:hypothetical protein